MKKKIRDEIKKIVADSIGEACSSIKDNSSYKDFSRWDSLANVKIVISLKNKFRILLKNEDIDKLNKVSDIYKLFKKYH